MLPQEIIRRKRDGHVLSAAEIEHLIEGLASERITEPTCSPSGSLSMKC